MKDIIENIDDIIEDIDDMIEDIEDNPIKGPIIFLIPAFISVIMLTVAVTSKFIRGYYLSNTCIFQMDKTLCYHKPTDTVYVIDPKGNPARIAPKQ